jgi:hypothetical protein
MSRLWTAMPIALMAAVPLWTAATASVLAIEALACLLCAAGVIAAAPTPVIAGAALGTVGYAVALWSGNPGSVDVVGAALFGLSVLLLLQMSEFARRFRGADIAEDVLRAQAAYWLGRVAIAAGAVAGLSLGGFLLSTLVPGESRAVVAGLGAVLAVAGALRAGIVRRPGDNHAPLAGNAGGGGAVGKDIEIPAGSDRK